MIKNLLTENELKEMMQKNKLLLLDCNIGDIVYRLWSCGQNGKSIASFEVFDIDVKQYPNIKYFLKSVKNDSGTIRYCYSKDFGKTVFLHKEDIR